MHNEKSLNNDIFPFSVLIKMYLLKIIFILPAWFTA